MKKIHLLLSIGFLASQINPVHAQQSTKEPALVVPQAAPAPAEPLPVVDPNAAPDVKAAQFINYLEARKAQRLKAIKAAINPKPPEARAIRKVVANFDEMVGKLQTLRKDVTISDGELGGMFAYVAKPAQPTKRVVLYLYGGGYVIGIKDFSNTSKYFISELANSAHAEVYAIDYRVAPENPFPAAVDDAYKAYLALLAKGIDPKNIFIAGGSSGGGLALSLLMKLRDEKKPMPAAVMVASPATDMAVTGESFKTKVDADPYFIPSTLTFLRTTYLNGHDPKDPYASPLYGSFEGLPPLMIVVGGRELQLSDSTRVAEKAKAAGVAVSLKVEDDMIHNYPVYGGILPKGKLAIDEMGKFINQHAAP
jgi:monoterpene epsilon-lactone hydrolase